jgi:hypothetical protein
MGYDASLDCKGKELELDEKVPMAGMKNWLLPT